MGFARISPFCHVDPGNNRLIRSDRSGIWEAGLGEAMRWIIVIWGGLALALAGCDSAQHVASASEDHRLDRWGAYGSDGTPGDDHYDPKQGREDIAAQYFKR